METKRPNYTETKAKSPGIPGNFPLGENKEGEYKGEMENVVKPSTLNQRCCSKSNEQNMTILKNFILPKKITDFLEKQYPNDTLNDTIFDILDNFCLEYEDGYTWTLSKEIRKEYYN